MFPRTLYLWWFGSQKIFKAMVDYAINLEGWLEDVTLFPNEPNDYSLNFDDLLINGKASNEDVLDTGLSDLQWLDEKVDISIFDESKGLLLQPNETSLLEDAASLLLGLIDSNLDTSYLSSDVSKNDLFEADTTQIQCQATYPVSSDLILASTYYESISEANSPAVSFFSDVSTDQASDLLCPSPGESISSSNSDLPVSVTVCDVTLGSDVDHVEEALSIDEVAYSMKNKKFLSNGKEIPKVILKNVFHPYSKPTNSRKHVNKNERKKVQNKEAAARYRIKKRIEDKELSGDVACLQIEQKKLQEKHDGLETEIKYLKSLMCEMFQKKGML